MFVPVLAAFFVVQGVGVAMSSVQSPYNTDHRREIVLKLFCAALCALCVSALGFRSNLLRNLVTSQQLQRPHHPRMIPFGAAMRATGIEQLLSGGGVG